MSLQDKSSVKIWTATQSSQSGFMVMENKALMVGNRSNFIACTKNGTVVSGQSLVFNVLAEDERHGGLFVKIPDLVQMIPTTLPTPMPQQVPFPPLAFVTTILKDMGFMYSMLNPPI